jgi:hypothetical protein
MNECTRVRDRMESDGSLEDRLSQADMDHAHSCGACAQDLGTYRAYTDLVAGARDALAFEEGGSPESWARLRSTAEKHERRAILEWMLQPALGLAMAAMVFWIASGPPSASSVLEERLSEQRPARPEDSILYQPRSSEVTGRSLGPGSVVAARSETRKLVAFDRHVMELAPRTRVTIVAWNPRRIVLNVTSGSVRAVVQRERDGDLFELRTAHARARALGTDYRVSVRQQGITSVRVNHGAVEVTDMTSGVTRVDAGESVRIDARGPLAQPASAKPQKERAPPTRASIPDAPGALPSPARGRPSMKSSPADAPKKPAAAAKYGLKVIEIDIAPQSAEPPGG